MPNLFSKHIYTKHQHPVSTSSDQILRRRKKDTLNEKTSNKNLRLGNEKTSKSFYGNAPPPEAQQSLLKMKRQA
jgi:hypothetical protein